MRALSAKVCASSSTFSTAFAGADLGAGAKGFAAGLLVVEKGFAAAEPGDENGLAFWLA